MSERTPSSQSGMQPKYDGEAVALTRYHCPGGLGMIAHNHGENGCEYTTYLRRDLPDALAEAVEALMRGEGDGANVRWALEVYRRETTP